jgi:hypothetical protein
MIVVTNVKIISKVMEALCIYNSKQWRLTTLELNFTNVFVPVRLKFQLKFVIIF